MPDLNLANPAVEQELTDAMKFWIGHGVDGFRLDAVRHYFESSAGGAAGEVDQPATYAFLRRLRASMDAVRPGTLLIGEAWTSATTVATYYGAGDGLQLAFSFDLADAIKQGLASGDAAPVINALAVAEQVFPDRGFEAPFLSNHDQARVLRSLGGNHAAMRAAAATLFALPGTPFVYYGEEIGMQGGSSSDDKDKRTAMRWNATAPGFGFGSNQPQIQRSEDPGTDVATQQADPASLWTLYRKLIALRHARAGLASAAAIRPAITGGGTGLVALQRGAPGERMLFVANYSASTSSPFSLSVSGTGTVLLSEGLASPPTPASGQLSFGGLGPYSFAFLSL
jgi:glycosidase